LVVNQVWKKTFKKKKGKKTFVLPDFVCWLLTFAVVDLAFVFFRSPSLRAALHYLRPLVSPHNIFGTANLRLMNGVGLMVIVYVIAQLIGTVVAFAGKSSEDLARNFKPVTLNIVATVGFFLVALVFLNSSISKPFVYFAF